MLFFSSSPTLNDDYKLIFLFCYRFRIYGSVCVCCVPCLIIIIVIVIILLSIQLFQCFPITNQMKRIEIEKERKNERKNKHHITLASSAVRPSNTILIRVLPHPSPPPFHNTHEYAHELFNANCIRYTNTHCHIVCAVPRRAEPCCPMWFCIVDGRATISMVIRR